MSSKALLSVIPKALLSPFPVVLHMDCTFKCNDNEFPILIIGITDACQVSSVISEHYFAPYPGDVRDGVTQLQPARPACATTFTFHPDYGMTDCIIVYTSNSL
jgi:hypothetical protein